MGRAGAIWPAQHSPLPCVLPTDGQNILDIVIPVVAVTLILGALGTAGYIYNYQRKIQKYELQKAQKEAALKLNAQSTPP